MLATLTGLWVQGQERPNVLIAFADDWGRFASAYQDQGPYSGLNRLLSTPTFDRVAQEGVLFQNAFVKKGSIPRDSTGTRLLNINYHGPYDAIRILERAT